MVRLLLPHLCIFKGSVLFYLNFSVGIKVFIIYSADLFKWLFITNICRDVSFYSLYDLSFFLLTNLSKDFSKLLIFWKNQLWLLSFLSLYILILALMFIIYFFIFFMGLVFHSFYRYLTCMVKGLKFNSKALHFLLRAMFTTFTIFQYVLT